MAQHRVKPLLHSSAICRRLTIRLDLMLRAPKGAVFKQTVRNIVIGNVQGRYDPAWVCACTLTSWSILQSVLGRSLYAAFWQRDKAPHRFGAVTTTVTVTSKTLGGPKALFRFLLNRLGQAADHVYYFSCFLIIYSPLLKVIASDSNAWKMASFLSHLPPLPKPYTVWSACDGCLSQASRNTVALPLLRVKVLALQNHPHY